MARDKEKERLSDAHGTPTTSVDIMRVRSHQCVDVFAAFGKWMA